MNNLISVKTGRLLFNINDFNFSMIFGGQTIKFDESFRAPSRKKETRSPRNNMNMALAIQQVTEDIVLKLGKTSRELTNSSNVVLAGG